MEIKHQVFVSSTYLDLVEERKSVIHALLELDCIPAGMELFPAADEDAWTLIKEVIDGCDYYVLILAGKYGTQNLEGVGYTEMEFDYAVSTNKPIIAFLHDNPESLPVNCSERKAEAQIKLNQFREKAKTKHCKYWTNAEDLGGKVSRSLVQLRKRHPSLGWVPGKYAASEEMLRETQELRARIAQLELEAAIGGNTPPPGTEDLAQGTDLVHLNIPIKNIRKSTPCTWDTLFAYVGASMMNESTDEEMMDKVELAFYHALSKEDQELISFEDITLPYVYEDRIRVQFQALGLIAPGIKRRALSDKGRYWRLTAYGEKYLLQIRAVRKKLNPDLAGT